MHRLVPFKSLNLDPPCSSEGPHIFHLLSYSITNESGPLPFRLRLGFWVGLWHLCFFVHTYIHCVLSRFWAPTPKFLGYPPTPVKHFKPLFSLSLILRSMRFWNLHTCICVYNWDVVWGFLFIWALGCTIGALTCFSRFCSHFIFFNITKVCPIKPFGRSLCFNTLVNKSIFISRPCVMSIAGMK